MSMSLPSYAMNQESFPEMYERQLVGPLFRPWVDAIIDETGIAAPGRVLDIACGTGIVARVARERLGDAKVVGVDLSRDMLAVARRLDPGVDWREGDACDLPLRHGEQFDLVVCQQGLQFFPDKPRAVAEMRRALAHDGKLAIAVWRSDDEIPFFCELRTAAERRLGPVSDQRYAFGDAAPIEALLRDAGFHDIRVRTISRTIRFEDGAMFARLNAMALVGMSAAGKAMDDEARKAAVDAIVRESAPVLKAYARGSGIAFDVGTNLATAGG
jgi:ubiquinone/menaquinone biosynthesis C-methylase UbiE